MKLSLVVVFALFSAVALAADPEDCQVLNPTNEKDLACNLCLNTLEGFSENFVDPEFQENVRITNKIFISL